jgi:hypothetical protein
MHTKLASGRKAVQKCFECPIRPAGDGYVHSNEAYEVDIPSMQGATAIGGKFYVSSSRGAGTSGSIYTFTKSSGPTEHAGALPPGPEDFSILGFPRPAEHPGNRSVLAIEASSF